MDPAETGQMRRTIAGVFGIEPSIVDLTKVTLVLDADLIVIFGRKAAQVFYDRLQPKVPSVMVPEPVKLIDIDGNEETRMWTWKTLSELKRNLDAPVSNEQDITPQEILPPKLTRNDVQELEKSSPNGWSGRTKSGRSIRLSAERTQEGSEDIKLTFTELYAIKVAMELLDITEFHLVTSKQSNHHSGS